MPVIPLELPDQLRYFMNPEAFATYQSTLERIRIVDTAQALLLERGIAAVELVDVALALRIPLAAVERQFPEGKPAVVEASLTTLFHDIDQRLLGLRDTSGSAVEELLAMRRLLQQQIGSTPSLFMQELPVLYPAIAHRLGYRRTTFMLEYLGANLERGLREGMYRPGRPVGEQAREWLEQLEALVQAARTSPELTDSYYDQLTRFLEEQTTATGRYVLRRLQEAYPFY